MLLLMSLERKNLHIFYKINRAESNFSVYYFCKKINLDMHHASKSFWSYYFNLLACEAFKELFIGQRGITKSMPEVKASYVFNSLLFPNQNMMLWGWSQERHMFFWVAYWELSWGHRTLKGLKKAMLSIPFLLCLSVYILLSFWD